MEKELVLAALIGLAAAAAAPLMGTNPFGYATNFQGTTSLTIPGIPANVTLLLNGFDGDLEVTSGGTVNVTATLDAGNKTLFLDIGGWTVQNGTSPLYQSVTITTPGTYNITAWSAADTNYTAGLSAHTLTVNPASVAPSAPYAGGSVGGSGGGMPANATRSRTRLEVIVLGGEKVLVNGTYLVPGSYFAETSGAEDLPVTQLGFLLNQETRLLMIVIERIPRPDGLLPLEVQYQTVTPYDYFRVTVLGEDPHKVFNSTTLAFKVDRGRALSQGINESTITLYHYDNEATPGMESASLATGAATGSMAYAYQGAWIREPAELMRSEQNYDYLVSRSVHGLETYYSIAGERMLGPFQLFILPSYVGPYYMQLIIVLLSIVLMVLFAERRAGSRETKAVKEDLGDTVELRKPAAQREVRRRKRKR